VAINVVAAATSHVPFFIAGGAFAVWAVVVSWLGLTRPAFPFGDVGQRAVMGVSVILAAVAVAMAIVTA
jgi:hypothetical protein